VNGKVYFPILIIAAMTTPLQGLPNVIVYLGPKFREARKLHPGAPFLKLVASSVSPVQPSVGPRDENIMQIDL
jgi:hypothetical protein